jgi:hypothetical protein
LKSHRKHLYIASFVWLVSFFGWAASEVFAQNNNVEIVAPTQTAGQSVSIPSLNASDIKTESSRRVEDVLLRPYEYNESGVRVRELQYVIGTLRIDGTYGPITRREHIEKLVAMGMPTENVPPTNATTLEYNIPSDKSKRCPMWEETFREAGLEPVEVFSYVAWRESGCRPEAQNAKWDANGNMTYHLNKDKSYDTGLLQINSSWYSVTKLVCGKDSVDGRMAGLKDPACNIAVAKYIMDNSKGKLGNWRVYKQ